mmetsp:Transcript_34577/g.33791  ORF Transcript_34577/g.33791 Transcript_34577/m.33791 type:complete len:90 (-) Transcript_34577:37-306(-)
MASKPLILFGFLYLILILAQTKDSEYSASCADNVYCNTWETCCLLDDDTYKCCPYQNGVCCPNVEFCCPESYECDTVNLLCNLNNSTVT